MLSFKIFDLIVVLFFLNIVIGFFIEIVGCLFILEWVMKMDFSERSMNKNDVCYF